MMKSDFTPLCWSAKVRVVFADLRLLPRGLIAMYGLVCWLTWQWFTGLADPNTQQVTFASMIWGAAAAWFGLYTNSGGKKGD